MLTVEVRDAHHGSFRRFQVSDEGRFFEFCRRAPELGVRYADFVFPYMDAMLNGFQLRAWLEDVAPLLDTQQIDEEQWGSVVEVFQAAREANAISGYLFFYG